MTTEINSGLDERSVGEASVDADRGEQLHKTADGVMALAVLAPESMLEHDC
jgi:hypothetical protein